MLFFHVFRILLIDILPIFHFYHALGSEYEKLACPASRQGSFNMRKIQLRFCGDGRMHINSFQSVVKSARSLICFCGLFKVVIGGIRCMKPADRGICAC